MKAFAPKTDRAHEWSKEAYALAAQAKSLSGSKIEQLVVRIQRHSGRTRDACWRFVIQHGLKSAVEHRRWSEMEIDKLREELVKHSVDVVARKFHRTPQAIRSILRRMQLSVRAIRCDLFSVESLATALHVGRPEILFWISAGWLPATVSQRASRKTYVIAPESLTYLYNNHHADVLKRGVTNQVLFEAYFQYCFVPKHTTGVQLLTVRRDKRERKAFEARQRAEEESPADDGEYED